MAYTLGIMRDKHAVQTILTKLKGPFAKRKLLVIFRRSHFPMQKKALEPFLGDPQYFSNPQSLKEVDNIY